MLQVSGHIKHVVVLVALLRIKTSLVVNVPTHLLSPVCEFLADFVDSHTAKMGLLRCCLYNHSVQITASFTTDDALSTHVVDTYKKSGASGRGTRFLNVKNASQPTIVKVCFPRGNSNKQRGSSVDMLINLFPSNSPPLASAAHVTRRRVLA